MTERDMAPIVAWLRGLVASGRFGDGAALERVGRAWVVSTAAAGPVLAFEVPDAAEGAALRAQHAAWGLPGNFVRVWTPGGLGGEA